MPSEGGPSRRKENSPGWTSVNRRRPSIPLCPGKPRSAVVPGGALGVELQCRRVDAVALAGRVGPVIEQVAEVGAAVLAHDLRAPHEQRLVVALLDLALLGGLVEAGPAGAGVELRARVEQVLAAHNAAVHAVVVAVVVLAGEGALGPGLLGHVVLLGGEPLAQLLRVNFLHVQEATDGPICYVARGRRGGAPRSCSCCAGSSSRDRHRSRWSRSAGR